MHPQYGQRHTSRYQHLVWVSISEFHSTHVPGLTSVTCKLHCNIPAFIVLLYIIGVIVFRHIVHCASPHSATRVYCSTHSKASKLLTLFAGTQLHFDTHTSVRRQLRWPTLHCWKRSGWLRTSRQSGLWDQHIHCFAKRDLSQQSLHRPGSHPIRSLLLLG